MNHFTVITMILALFFSAVPAVAEENDADNATQLDAVRPTLNLDSVTLGGKQLWTDEYLYGEWRIQRNVMSRHYRLLDDRNVRRAWGTFEQCEAEFARMKAERELEPLRPRVVILLHGLVRSRESMDEMATYLKENGDFSVLNVSYASTREGLAEHAKALARIIERLDGVREVNFVAHSMGNLVIRHYLSDLNGLDARRSEIPQIGRWVMLAAPNGGADLALRFQDNLLFKAVWGESGRELSEGWQDLEKRLARPNCEFGIIAGGRGDSKGFNPLIEGDDDFVVAVDETRLAGARDFLVLPVVHGTIMDDSRVQEYTLRFLERGYFLSDARRQPIKVEDASQHE